MIRVMRAYRLTKCNTFADFYSIEVEWAWYLHSTKPWLLTRAAASDTNKGRDEVQAQIFQNTPHPFFQEHQARQLQLHYLRRHCQREGGG